MPFSTAIQLTIKGTGDDGGCAQAAPLSLRN